MMKRIASFLFAMLLVFSLPVTAFAADSSVTFTDGKLIVCEPGSAKSDTDLFDSFKNVMPGDVLNETITIQNKNKSYDYIKVYLRAEAPSAKNIVSVDNPNSDTVAAMNAFLSQLSLKVYNGSKLIYSGSPDKTGTLTKSVFLGKLAKKGTLDLKLELTVPIEMDNTYMDATGEVDWIFTVEGYNNTSSGGGSGGWIQTGQLNWPIAVLSVLGVGLIAFGIILVKKKKKDNRA